MAEKKYISPKGHMSRIYNDYNSVEGNQPVLTWGKYLSVFIIIFFSEFNFFLYLF